MNYGVKYLLLFMLIFLGVPRLVLWLAVNGHIWLAIIILYVPLWWFADGITTRILERWDI